MTRFQFQAAGGVLFGLDKIRMLAAVFVLLAICTTPQSLHSQTGDACDAQDLVAYWKFDEGGGPIAGDAIGGNDGTISGADWITGQVDGALRFDGDTYVVVPDSPELNPPHFSVSLWLRLTADAPFGGTALAEKDGWHAGQTGYGFFLGGWNGPNSVRFEIFQPWTVLDSSVSLELNHWHHLVATYDRNFMKIFIDGELTGSRTASQGVNTGNDGVLGIGARFNNGGKVEENDLVGLVDEMTFYRRALTEEELQRHYQRGLTGLGHLECADRDGDGVSDDLDNCPELANPGQTDTDLDGTGDACDEDDDNDGILDGLDNCQFTPNLEQYDTDMDGAGDACDVDLDGDGICQGGVLEGSCTGVNDNCPFDPNEYQTDTDLDGLGDACDADDDNDGICDTSEAHEGSCAAGPDNCPITVNSGQEDLDADDIGDVCDADVDGDGICEGPDPIAGVCSAGNDNCPVVPNSDQEDTDGDGDGDACDDDDDNDGVFDGDDNCALIPNFDQLDTDEDGRGDVCDADLDGDGVDNDIDNCPYDANASQADFDGDGQGDVCDPDDDGDDVVDTLDVCAGTPYGAVVDPENGCSIDQLCPCDGPRGSSAWWRNHGKYVSCVAHAAADSVDLGLISKGEKDAIVSEAAQSTCGKKK